MGLKTATNKKVNQMPNVDTYEMKINDGRTHRQTNVTVSDFFNSADHLLKPISFFRMKSISCNQLNPSNKYTELTN